MYWLKLDSICRRTCTSNKLPLRELGPCRCLKYIRLGALYFSHVHSQSRWLWKFWSVQDPLDQDFRSSLVAIVAANWTFAWFQIRFKLIPPRCIIQFSFSSLFHRVESPWYVPGVEKPRLYHFRVVVQASDRKKTQELTIQTEGVKRM